MKEKCIENGKDIYYMQVTKKRNSDKFGENNK